jgi:hypothetical protein
VIHHAGKAPVEIPLIQTMSWDVLECQLLEDMGVYASLEHIQWLVNRLRSDLLVGSTELSDKLLLCIRAF